MKILFVNDFSSTAYLFEKHLSAKVDAIYFQKEPIISLVKNPLFFIKDNIVKQVEKIKELSNKYDVFISMGWLASAICYLANVNYIIHIVDPYIEPKDRIQKKMNLFKTYFWSNLYKDTFDSALGVVSCGRYFTQTVKKYHSNVVEIIGFTDPSRFHTNVKKIDLGQNKFTFFSPQRIESNKGQLAMWKAIEKTKSDFVVLQTNWGEGKYYQKVIETKPDKVKIIPRIVHNDISSYYASSDALLGQISFNNSSHVENEAILCGKPVFAYTDYGFTTYDPFCKSNNPCEIAKYIDRMVEDKEFREELVKIQNKWLRETFDNKKHASDWETFLEKTLKKDNKRNIKKRYEIVLNIYANLSNRI